MLRKIRILLAVAALCATTLLFIDTTATAAQLWPWMARVQFVPAVLALNLLVVAAIVAITWLVGRVYCSVVCPLGVMQDVVIWLRKRLSTKKKRKKLHRFSAAHQRVRIGVLVGFVALLCLGLVTATASAIALLIEPYSAFGRIATSLLRPLAVWASASTDTLPVVPLSVEIITLTVAAATLIVVTVTAWRSGRAYCNTICPVGTVLGLISRHAVVAPHINLDKCVSCGSCGRRCKAHCIDTANHTIDLSRCVACFDCVDACSEGAISFTTKKIAHTTNEAPEDASRRAFLVSTAIVTGAVTASAARRVAKLRTKQPAERTTLPMPAGAVSVSNFESRCVACQLCVTACKQGILRPSTSLLSPMRPQMDFTRGYCQPDCTACSKVCPAGAIMPITAEQKRRIQIGVATVDVSTCISSAYGQHCGSCAAHCPASAITMERGANGNAVPTVDASRCLGCGACEYHCPVGTLQSLSATVAAIHVEGRTPHSTVSEIVAREQPTAPAGESGCVNCHHCMPCPYGVDIPGTLRAHDEAVRLGLTGDQVRQYILRRVNRANLPDRCIGCGACRSRCPNRIAIPTLMQQLTR